MDTRPRDTFITDQDWIRLRQWSEGYDAGWGMDRVAVSPVIPPDQPDYAAGFIRGQRDWLDLEREQYH